MHPENEAMKAVLYSLFLLTIGVLSVSAAEYLGDRRWLASPDNHHLLTFSGDNPSLPDAFVIQDLHGKALFSSRECPALRDVFNYEPEHARWSSDGLVLAVAAGHSKSLLTYIFARSGDTFVSVPVPPLADGHDNPWILPIEWLKDRTLRVTISGPHAGKARGSGYSGEAKLRVTLDPFKCDKTFERIKWTRRQSRTKRMRANSSDGIYRIGNVFRSPSTDPRRYARM